MRAIRSLASVTSLHLGFLRSYTLISVGLPPALQELSVGTLILTMFEVRGLGVEASVPAFLNAYPDLRIHIYELDQRFVNPSTAAEWDAMEEEFWAWKEIFPDVIVASKIAPIVEPDLADEDADEDDQLEEGKIATAISGNGQSDGGVHRCACGNQADVIGIDNESHTKQ